MNGDQFLKYIGFRPVVPLESEEEEQPSLRQGLKNLVGDLLGYGRCSVTEDTYWRTQLASVPYSPHSGVIISVRALAEVPKDEIAQAVLQRGNQLGTIDLTRYCLEQIISQIPEGCFVFPKR